MFLSWQQKNKQKYIRSIHVDDSIVITVFSVIITDISKVYGTHLYMFCLFGYKEAKIAHSIRNIGESIHCAKNLLPHNHTLSISFSIYFILCHLHWFKGIIKMYRHIEHVEDFSILLSLPLMLARLLNHHHPQIHTHKIYTHTYTQHHVGLFHTRHLCWFCEMGEHALSVSFFLFQTVYLYARMENVQRWHLMQ